MDREEYSRARMTDAHIDELVQDVQQGQRLVDAPELRMAHDIRHAYQAETREDVRSLERVLARLIGDQAAAQPQVLFLPHGSEQEERISNMQHNMVTLDRGKTSRRWQQHAGLLAAVLFLALLVGGLLTVLGVAHAGHTSTPTARGTLPASSFASNVIASVGLSDNANQIGQAPTVQRFTVGQTIWLTSVINVGKMTGSGILTVKWYENDLLYATSTRDFQAPKEQGVATAMKAIPMRARQVYTQPGDAKVEVYWNGQLVTTLHFVIDPKAQQ
jgi:hypothetical protein